MAIGQNINIQINSVFDASGFKKAQKEFESVQSRFQDLNSTFSTAKGIVRMNNRMDEMQAVARDAGLEMDKMGRFFEEGSRDADKMVNSFKDLEEISGIGGKIRERLEDDFDTIGDLARAAGQDLESFENRLQQVDQIDEARAGNIAGPLQSRVAGGLDEGQAIQQLKERMESLSPIARRLGTSVEEVAKASQKTGLQAENLSTIAERTGSSMKEIVNASNMTQRSLIELSSVSTISGDGIEDVAHAAKSAGLSASKLRKIADLTSSSMREVSEVADMTDSNLMSLAQIANASGNSMRDIARASKITGLSMSKASQVADRNTRTLRELKNVADASNRSVMQLSSAYDRSVGSVTNVARAADRLDSSFGEVSNTLRQSNRRLIEMGGSLRVLDTATGNIRDLDQGMRQARNATKMFNFEFLSTMFIGMQFSRIFGRMLRPALEMTGVMEEFRTTMKSVNGPLMRFISGGIRQVLDILQNLGPLGKGAVSVLILLGFVASKVAFFFSQLQLGFQGMSMAANKSGSTLGSFKGILDAVGLTFLTSSNAAEDFTLDMAQLDRTVDMANSSLQQTDDAARSASSGMATASSATDGFNFSLQRTDDAARNARNGILSLSTATKGVFFAGALLPVLDILGVMPEEMNSMATAAISLASVMPILAESNMITSLSFKSVAAAANAAKVALLTNPITALAAVALAGAAALFTLAGGFDGVREKIDELFDSFSLGEFGAQLFSGAIREIGNAFQYVVDKGNKIGGSITSWLAKVVKQGKKKLRSWWQSLMKFASNKLPKAVSFIKKKLGGIMKSGTVKKIKSFLTNLFKDPVGTIKSVIGNAKSFVISKISDITSGVKKRLGGLMSSGRIKKIKSFLKNLFKDPVGTIKSVIGRAKSFVISKISGIASSGPVKRVKSFLKGIFEETLSTAKNKLNSVKDKVSAAFTFISNLDPIEKAKNTLKDAFSDAKTAIFDTMSNLKNGVINSWENVKSGLSDTVPDLDINIPDWLQTALETGGDVASSAFDFMGGAITAPMSTDKNDFLVSDGRLVPFSSQDMIMGMKDPARLEASGGGQGTNVVEFRPETQINITAEEQVDVEELKDELGDRWISELEQKVSGGL